MRTAQMYKPNFIANILLVVLVSVVALLRQQDTLSTIWSTDLLLLRSEKEAAVDNLNNDTLARNEHNEEKPSSRAAFEVDRFSFNHQQAIPPFRMVLGIFSMEAKSEYKRRKLIYNTYLSFPKYMKRHNVTTMSLDKTRICSLNEFMKGNISHHESCQLLYTFVVGAAKESDPTASTEYLNISAERPMTLKNFEIKNSRADATYLNILENMNEGKSITWFKYASSQIPDHFKIDIIAKVDSDCVIFPTLLLEEIDRIRKEKGLEYPLENVYGGSRQLGLDKSYMQGGFYFISRDIAQYISSDRCDRESIIAEYTPQYKNKRAEDVEISRFVLSYPRTIHELEIPRMAAYGKLFAVEGIGRPDHESGRNFRLNCFVIL